MSKPVISTSRGQRADIGAYKIQRMLANEHVAAVGPFVFLDYGPPMQHAPTAAPQRANGTGAHPHRGIATLTYVLSGEALHHDSRGHVALVRSGGAQWMSAGNGIVHDEAMNPDPATGTQLTHGLQFWINLPARQKAQPPAYRSLPAAELPTVALPGGAGWLKVIVGEWAGQESPAPTYSPQFLYHVHLEAGQRLHLPTTAGHEYAALVLNQPATVSGATYQPGEFLLFDPAIAAPLDLAAPAAAATDILVFGGAPYTEPIVAQGPFVMNSRQEIMQAYNDFHQGLYGTIDYSRTPAPQLAYARAAHILSKQSAYCKLVKRTIMQLGIDSFALHGLGDGGPTKSQGAVLMGQLLDRIVHADQAGLDVFGIGEHHRVEFLDSAPALILAAAAARTARIRLTSAVTVLSAADPVRVFQEFATLDLLSQGRAELVVGRGSFTESFPLFGYQLKDYDALFAEKLDLLLTLRDHEHVTWKGRFRPALTGQGVYPRPVQAQLPVWLDVGGTPASFVRAGTLGLPLMIAIIGGEPARFRPLVDLYREAGRRAGHAPEQLPVGMHALGYVAPTTEEAVRDYIPGYLRFMAQGARERGWPPPTRTHFEAQRGPQGALLVGSPDEVAAKILRHSEALGGLARVTIQPDALTSTDEAGHAKLLRAIELLGTRVAPQLVGQLAARR